MNFSAKLPITNHIEATNERKKERKKLYTIGSGANTIAVVNCRYSDRHNLQVLIHNVRRSRTISSIKYYKLYRHIQTHFATTQFSSIWLCLICCNVCLDVVFLRPTTTLHALALHYGSGHTNTHTLKVHTTHNSCCGEHCYFSSNSIRVVISMHCC